MAKSINSKKTENSPDYNIKLNDRYSAMIKKSKKKKKDLSDELLNDEVPEENELSSTIEQKQDENAETNLESELQEGLDPVDKYHHEHKDYNDALDKIKQTMEPHPEKVYESKSEEEPSQDIKESKSDSNDDINESNSIQGHKIEEVRELVKSREFYDLVDYKHLDKELVKDIKRYEPKYDNTQV